MQSIFISSTAIIRPAFFAKYYTANGDHYQRIESAISPASFDRDSEAVRIELYENSSSPVRVEVLERG